MIFSVEARDLDLELDLPLSKSESNRALMIAFYAGKELYDVPISDSDDTRLLQRIIDKINNADKRDVVEIDCANAGTVFRFLMTALSMEEGCWVLTGSERMRQRPIGALVDTLRSLGVEIEYLAEESYPPVILRGCRVNGGETVVCAEQSSQFVSSLLLAAPLWENGLNLHIKGVISSLPYIDMTINMMKKCGIDVLRNDRDIIVKPGIYNLDGIVIEPDWSAAAFWYEMTALSNSTRIVLNNLNINSLQADSVSSRLFELMGVKSMAVKNGVMIERNNSITGQLKFDFTNSPDLFPAVIATCAGLQVDAIFSGLRNLSVKESDRKKAMMNELSKINVSFKNVSEDTLEMLAPDVLPRFTENNPLIFNNYADHRIAMALSILSMKIGAVSMNNIEVVSKSYPNFYEIIDRSCRL